MSECKPMGRRERRFAGSREAPWRSGGAAPIDFARRFLIGAAVFGCFSAAPAGAAVGEAKPFGIASFSTQTTEASLGSGLVNEPYLFTQAGGHPFALTSTVKFASEEIGPDHTVVPTHDPKDIVIDLPPGLLADPQAVAHCSFGGPEHCPTDTQVGVFVLHFVFGGNQTAILGPIVNLTPGGGQSAELGLETPLGTFLLTGRVVRVAQGYTVAIRGSGLPALGIVSMEITLWGVPAARAHDPQRGLSCTGSGANQGWSCQGGSVASGEEPVAFLTMPGNCSGAPLTTVAWADSWEQPGRYVQAQSTLPRMAYCERLPFWPEITVRPETLLADQPVGLTVSIRVPQLGNAAVVATPQLRDATVTLPQGVSINPSVAGGLRTCDPSGPAGINIPTGLNERGEPLAPGEVGPGEEPGPDGEPQLAPGHCPKESIVGTAEASTPLLPRPIQGRVYTAMPGCGGSGQHGCTEQDAVDGNLYRLYVVLDGNTQRNEGVLLKVEALVQANPATGQLTMRLTEMPQLPLSELNIRLSGGPSALLANPATCGTATTTSDLEPWSAPGTPDNEPSSFYDVKGCSGSGLHPGFVAGSINASAGAFSPFTLTVTRRDGEPYLAGLKVHGPPGLSAMLSSVPLCPETLASTGKCPEASRVGSSRVVAGAGSQPLYLPGDMYLTGAYEGAPFGLSIVTNADAGPLNLGLIVIRARIDIDPQTAALTITSDPLPQIALGVPLRIQRVTLNLDRPHFIFNPTSCETQRITTTIAGSQGTSADVSNRFALGDCASLAFKPKLAASASAHKSYTNGTSLDMKLTFPQAEQGTDANLARIKIALPRQLPSRLTTLQSACLDMTFNTDPAACPKGSVVGMASAQTPVLPGQLTGPVYVVTRGREAFPSPIVVLQGDGVRLNLVGTTIIDKAGIASVAFNAIPDVPITRLELYLPQGPHSLLSANTSLCARAKTVIARRNIAQRAHGLISHRTVKTRERVPASLLMPTEFVAQNGAVVHRNTKIEVTGCAASKAKTARRLQTAMRIRRDLASGRSTTGHIRRP